MKRILALFLALVMLLALTACDTGNEGAPAGESAPSTNGSSSSVPSSSASASSVPATSTPASSTPASSAPATSTPDSTSSSQTSHTHSYNSKVTTAATCDKEGITTFTCSCGDSYTEKIAATGQHSWGSWSTETVALVNRTGTDKRTCSTCSAAETRENTENVLENSFYDPGLGQLFYWGFNYDGSLRVYSLLEYAPYRYDKFAYKENSTDTIYDTLAKSFVLDDSFKDKIRAEGKANPYYYGYNEANDTFTFEGNNMGSMGNAEPVGYIHNGGNQYTVYYSFAENGSDTEQIYKVVLEFKRTDRFDMRDWKLNGEENKYLSFEKVSSVPSDLTK